MEYILIIILQVIGIAFQVFPKIHELDKKFENDTLWDVIKTFWSNDKFTLFLSIVIICFNLVAHYIIDAYTELPKDVKYYPLYSFGIALVLGYAGQTIIYKYLGKAEQALIKKADKIDKL